MLQWFLRFSEFAEFKENSVLFRENPNNINLLPRIPELQENSDMYFMGLFSWIHNEICCLDNTVEQSNGKFRTYLSYIEEINSKWISGSTSKYACVSNPIPNLITYTWIWHTISIWYQQLEVLIQKYSRKRQV